MDEITWDDIRYGPFIIRILYNDDHPYDWHRVPKVYSEPPDWLKSAMNAYVEHDGFGGMEARDYLVSLFGEQF